MQTPSLHDHVAGLPGLRRVLALRGLCEVVLRPQRAAVGKARELALLALAHAYRAFAREHPGQYTAAVRAPDPAGTEWSVAYEEQMRIFWWCAWTCPHDRGSPDNLVKSKSGKSALSLTRCGPVGTVRR